MGIFSRLSDIINANITATLERAENPEKMVRLMIQEMEETLVEVRTNAARIIADRKETRRRLERLADAQEEWQRKARLALQKGREDLAKGALLEKTRLAETAAGLEAELAHLDEAMTRHDEDIAKLESKLREVRTKQRAIRARHDVANSRLQMRERLNDGRIEEAFARFQQMERRLDETEGQVEAFDLGRGKTLSEEIAELEAETAIERELADMRAGLDDGNDNGRGGEGR